MGFSMRKQGAGQPLGKPDPSVNTPKTEWTVLCLPVGLVMFTKIQTWPIFLAFMPFFVGTAAYDEGHWGSLEQMIPAGMRSETTDQSLFQNSTSGLKMAGQDLRNHSREGHAPLQVTGGNLYTQSLFVNDINTAELSQTVNTQLDSNKTSQSIELKSGEGLLSMGSSALQLDHRRSQDLGRTASLALAKTADVSPDLPSKRFKALEDTTTSSSIPQAVEHGEMEMAYSTRALPIFSPASLHPDFKTSSFSNSNAAHQTVLAEASAPLDVASSLPSPILTSEHLTGPREAPEAEQGLHGTYLPSTERVSRAKVNQTNADYSTMVLSKQFGLPSSRYKMKNVTSIAAVSPESMGTSIPSPVVTTPGIIDTGFIDSRGTQGSFSHQQLQSLNTMLSQQTFNPTTVESPNLSASSVSTDGTNHDPERYKEDHLSSDFNDRGHTAIALPAHGHLSAIGQDSSSYQASVGRTTMQWSEIFRATAGSPFRKEVFPIASNTPKSESFLDLATQLVTVTPSHVLRSLGAVLPHFNLSLATTQPDPDVTTFSTPTEVHLFLGQQSSGLKEHLTISDGTSLSPYHSTTREHRGSSLTLYDMLSTSPGEGPKLILKEGTAHAGKKHDFITNARGGVTSFDTGSLSWQGSTLLLLRTLHSEDVETAYDVPLGQARPPKATSKSVSYKEMVNTEVSSRKRESTEAAVEMAVSSELPRTTSGDTLPVRLAPSFLSEEPEAQLVGQHHTLPGKRNETTSTPSDSTSVSTSRIRLISKELSKSEAPAMVITTKKAYDAVAHTLTAETDGSLISHPYLDTEEAILPVGTTFARIAHADLQTDTTSLLNLTEPGRSSVVPTHHSLSLNFTSLGPTNNSLPSSALKINMEATGQLMAKKEQMIPLITRLFTSSDAELWRSTTTSSPTAAGTKHGGAEMLFTKILGLDLETSAVAPTEGPILGYKVTDTSSAVVPLTTGVTALHVHNPNYTYFSNSETPVYRSVSETQPTWAVPVSSSSAVSLSDQRRTVPAPFDISQNTSAEPPNPTQPFVPRKASVSTLGSTRSRKDMTLTVKSSEMTIQKEVNVRVLPSGKPVTLIQKGYTLEEEVPKFKNPVVSWSAEKEQLATVGASTPPVPAVRLLPLSFRLAGINYTESLENKFSESYKKLEKEVKLMLNKILSTYQNFLRTNILRFVNGSVTVLGEAVFQAGPPIPTPSDTIRTIVTEVETKGRDAFFDWRMDVRSLQSSGFDLSNLEPEKLAISFTILGLRPRSTFGDMDIWVHLESLRSKVTFMLGARYTVQNISLADVRSIEGGANISGEVYVDTHTHVDIDWALKALLGLSNYSVDLTSLSINGSRLWLQVFPVSFLVTNIIFDEKMMDRSSVEHQNLAKDLADVLVHILRKYKSFLQVAIREITGGSLLCRGDVIFQPPAPTSKDLLRTLALSVGPEDYLDSSGLQVDPFSFNVAGHGLEPPFTNLGIPRYGIAIIVLSVLLIIALPILVLLPKMLGRKDRIIINRAPDPEAAVEIFELENPAYRSTSEAAHLDCLDPKEMPTVSCNPDPQQLGGSITSCSNEGVMSHSI